MSDSQPGPLDFGLPYLPEAPDFLGNAARVDSVSTLLQRAQEQYQHLKHIMILNGQGPDDRVAIDTNQAEGENAPTPTYRERFESLSSGMQALLAENEDIAEDLQLEAAKRRKAIERRLENAS